MTLSSLALVLVIVVDQLRMDEYFRARPHLSKSGFVKVLDQGILYEDAHQAGFFNLTCPGHVGISTGATAALHGITANNDYDRKLKKKIYCVSDLDQKWIDAESGESPEMTGTSAKRILTTTFGDELKTLYGDKSKVFSIALKDRTAIGLAGHVADGVFWFAPKNHAWATSTYYQKNGKLPVWLSKVNAGLQARRPKTPDTKFVTPQAVMNLTDLAIEVSKNEKLGLHVKPDVLMIGYSSYDAIGHHFGDDSPELLENFKLMDTQVSKLLETLQKQVGSKKIMVVVTSDHGAAGHIPKLSAQGIPAGQMDSDEVNKKIISCLEKEKIVSEKVLLQGVYLSNPEKLDFSQLEKAKACVKNSHEGFLYALAKPDILKNNIPQVPWLKNLARSIHPDRAPDVISVLKPYWNADNDHPVTHETPYDYDSWVPISFWWPGIKSQKIFHRVEVASLAPTLSHILETRRPSGASSELLKEVLEK